MTLSEVIDTLQTWIRNADDEYDREEMGRVAGLKEALHEIKKIDLCEDAISREDALEALCRAVHKNDDSIPCSNQRVSCLWNKTKVQDYAEEILKLPPVTPLQVWSIDGKVGEINNQEAVIELAIKIPKEEYEQIKKDIPKLMSVPSLYKIIANGTPLPGDNTVVVDCAHICQDCKYEKLSPYKEPCESCSIKDLDMTTFIDNFEQKEDKNE